jgi:FkbM family methyltransferase
LPTTVAGLTALIWNHPANRKRRLKALARSVAWQAYKHTVGRPLTIDAFGDLKFRAYSDSTAPGRLLYFGGLPDYDEMWFMRRYLRPGDSVIDGGANAGLYTLLAAKLVGKSGRVDAFEAAPATVQRLRENVTLNALSQVHVHHAALAEEAKTVSFTVDRAKDASNRIRTGDDSANTTVEVEAVSLDEMLTGEYAFGKLDIEGAEPLALSGASMMLAKHNPPVWQLELVDRFVQRFGWSALDVASLLRAHGYELALYDADTGELRFGEGSLGSRTDVLAIATDSLERVMNRLSGHDN